MANGLRQLFGLATLVVFSSAAPALDLEVPGCGNLSTGYGPFDYRTATAGEIGIVEQYHWNSDIESLKTGITTSFVVIELDYVLRALPNHPRALGAVVRYELGGGKFTQVHIPGADCYLRRALALAPDDPAVYLIYGNYLFKSKALDKADEMYSTALRLKPNSPEIAYNAGLFYVEKGDLAKAEALAKIAYDQGYPFPGLRRKIDAAKQAAAQPRQAAARSQTPAKGAKKTAAAGSRP